MTASNFVEPSTGKTNPANERKMILSKVRNKPRFGALHALGTAKRESLQQ